MDEQKRFIGFCNILIIILAIIGFNVKAVCTTEFIEYYNNNMTLERNIINDTKECYTLIEFYKEKRKINERVIERFLNHSTKNYSWMSEEVLSFNISSS